MNFVIKPLHTINDTMRLYHLFDDDDSLVMVADYGSPWSSSEANQQVRFAWPNGTSLAILDLQSANHKQSGNKQHTDFALVMGYAVYSMISHYHSSITSDGLPEHYFVIKMEEMEWLALPEGDDLLIYGTVPFSFVSRCHVPDVAILPDVIGRLTAVSPTSPDKTISLPFGSISHTPLIALALSFLLEHTKQLSL